MSIYDGNHAECLGCGHVGNIFEGMTKINGCWWHRECRRVAEEEARNYVAPPEPPTLEQQLATATAEVAALRGLLAETTGTLEHLLTVKAHKDANGKDEWYEREQPLAWERARKAAEAARAVGGGDG